MGVRFLTDDALFDVCGVRIMFTQRLGGHSEAPYDSLNLGSHVGDDPATVERNRELLMSVLAAQCDGGPGGERQPAQTHPASSQSPIVPNQVHGDRVACVAWDDSDPREAAIAEELASGADAVVVCRAWRPAFLCFADCAPVILASPTGVFAIAHSGWRGSIAGIAGKAAKMLSDSCGCDAREINAYIGPHICGACYEVSEDLEMRFAGAFGPECIPRERHVSLSRAVAASLEAAGVAPRRICDAVRIPGLCACTMEHPERYYSHRASSGHTGRFAAAAMSVAAEQRT